MTGSLGILNFAKNSIEKILSLMFPGTCQVCKNSLEMNENKVCDKCVGSIEKVEICCNKCGRPLDLKQDWCADCRDKRIYYEKLFVGFYYEGVVKYFLHQLKYNPSEKSLENLDFFYNLLCSNEELLDELKTLSENIDFIIPVPIHRSRLQKRGYNQSVLLANILQDLLGIEMDETIIKKAKNTQFFFKLSKEKREKELGNAFEVSIPEILLGKNILLVDDISTTGLTINSITKLLVEKGANSVFVFCMAHGD